MALAAVMLVGGGCPATSRAPGRGALLPANGTATAPVPVPVPIPAPPPLSISVSASTADAAHARASAPSAPGRVPLGRIGWWNAKRLGESYKDDEAFARILLTFDVVALGEVMSDSAADSVVRRLNRHPPEPGASSASRWASVQSERGVGRGDRYKEWYAVLFRSAASCDGRSAQLYPDPGDVFAREPFGVECRVGTFDFWLVSVHIVFGKSVAGRATEVEHLAEVFRWFAERDPAEHDVILVGDFNLVPTHPAWSLLPSALRRVVPPEVLTSMGSDGHLAHHYDDIVVDPARTTELVGAGLAVDLAPVAGTRAEAYRLVSDHRPVVAEFRIDGRDDD